MTTRTTTRTTTTTTRTRTRTRRRTRSNNNNDDNNDNDDDDNDADDNEDAARSMSCPQVQMKSPSLFPSPDPYRHRRCAKLYNNLACLNEWNCNDYQLSPNYPYGEPRPIDSPWSSQFLGALAALFTNRCLEPEICGSGIHQECPCGKNRRGRFGIPYIII